MLSALFQKKRFEQAVRAYSGDLFRYLYWACRDRAQAEDLVQETFARAWAAWERQEDANAVKAWLFTIARREHARLFERKALEVDAEGDLDAIADPLPADPALALDMARALAALPLAYREPLLLQVLGGLTGAEIAAACGCSEEAALMRLSRGRRALRNRFEDAPPRAASTRSSP
jgi:RNA polymerase sigma-70 factor (ECF subfamily)